MTEAAERKAVWAEAMTWEGTPYHHRANLKGVGADCARFPLEVYITCGILERFEPGAYSPQWHLHKMAELYLDVVRKHARPIPRAEAAMGDFGVWRYGNTFSHGAIIGSPPEIIHATIRGRCVHLGNMDRDDDLLTREALFFSPWRAAE